MFIVGYLQNVGTSMRTVGIYLPRTKKYIKLLNKYRRMVSKKKDTAKTKTPKLSA